MSAIPCFTLNNGRSFPVLGFGTWAFEETGQRETLNQSIYDAIVAGYRHIDTAWIYKVEHQVGAAVRKAIDDGIVKREDMCIVTKIWVTNMTRDRLLEQAKESVARLGLDYTDVLLVHWPVPMRDTGKNCYFGFPLKENDSYNIADDVDMYNETWPAMEQCVDQGIAKSIGVSNFTVSQLRHLCSVARIKPVVNQVESNPILPNDNILAACKELGVIMTAYMPFGGSVFPGSGGDEKTVKKPTVKEILFSSPIVKSIAEKHKKSVAQILLRFHIQRGVATIPKTVTRSRIIENTQVFDFELTPADMDALKELKRDQRICFIPQFVVSKYNPFV